MDDLSPCLPSSETRKLLTQVGASSIVPSEGIDAACETVDAEGEIVRLEDGSVVLTIKFQFPYYMTKDRYPVPHHLDPYDVERNLETLGDVSDPTRWVPIVVNPNGGQEFQFVRGTVGIPIAGDQDISEPPRVSLVHRIELRAYEQVGSQLALVQSMAFTQVPIVADKVVELFLKNLAGTVHELEIYLTAADAASRNSIVTLPALRLPSLPSTRLLSFVNGIPVLSSVGGAAMAAEPDSSIGPADAQPCDDKCVGYKDGVAAGMRHTARACGNAGNKCPASTYYANPGQSYGTGGFGGHLSPVDWAGTRGGYDFFFYMRPASATFGSRQAMVGTVQTPLFTPSMDLTVRVTPLWVLTGYMTASCDDPHPSWAQTAGGGCAAGGTYLALDFELAEYSSSGARQPKTLWKDQRYFESVTNYVEWCPPLPGRPYPFDTWSLLLPFCWKNVESGESDQIYNRALVSRSYEYTLEKGTWYDLQTRLAASLCCATQYNLPDIPNMDARFLGFKLELIQ